LRRQIPHFWGCSITASIRARSGLNTHSKLLKIVTTFTVRTLSPYKDYSSLLRWQADMCSYIATTELCRWRHVVDFEFLTYFVVAGIIWLFVALVELLELWMLLLLFMMILVVCEYLVGHYGHEWAWKCWSAMDMSGHVSASALRACVKVDDYLIHLL
jgi:hypothetical protein